jgi:hypothetical protein
MASIKSHTNFRNYLPCFWFHTILEVGPGKFFARKLFVGESFAGKISSGDNDSNEK